MDIGFYLPETGPVMRAPSLISICSVAERLGFAHCVIGDHIIVPTEIDSDYPYTVSGQNLTFESGEYLEQLSLIAFLAGATTQLRFVASVMVLPHRPPILAAKMIATIDALSDGRFILGAGVGWNREEFEILGVGPFKRRGRVSDEYLDAFKEMWSNRRPEYDGEFVELTGFTFSPQPPAGRIPIWIGGNSDAAINRAGRIGDCWHPVGGVPKAPLEPRELRASRERLEEAVSRYGRSSGEVGIALKAPRYDAHQDRVEGRRRRFTGSRDDLLQDLAEYERAGIDCLIVDARAPSEGEAIEWLHFYADALIPAMS